MKHTHACHHCQEQFSFDTSDFPMAAHSCLIVLQKAEMDGYSNYQCNEGQLTDFHTWQHWHCCHEHMKQGLLTCVNEHYSENRISTRKFTRFGFFHKIVLVSGLSCKMCNKKLDTVAYRFCITMATPYNYVPDDSQNDLGEWCCSLICAKKSVILNINSIEERFSHGVQ